MRHIFLIYLALAGSLFGATSSVFTYKSETPSSTAISEEFQFSHAPSFYSDSFTFEFGFKETEHDIDLFLDTDSSLPGAWHELDWFGYYFPTEFGWLFHYELGWLYPSTESLKSIWFFNPSLVNLDQTSGKWIWTNDEVFPFLYMQINHTEPSYQLLDSYPWTWTYIDLKTNRKERFYDYSSSSWLNLE